jgi:hypothetical protein
MFQLFPRIDYQIDEYDRLRAVDITISAKIKKYLRSYRALALRPYIVKNGDLPEIVANKIYGSPRYSYILIAINDVQSVYDDWPKNFEVFKDYIKEKYGSIGYAQSTTHAWYTGQGHIVSEEYWLSITDSGKYTKTIYEYESDLNDKKAEINIMDFRYVVDFESKLQEILVSN